MTLRARICAEIARCGPIPFSRYMELCLYEPELGYYSRAREPFGKAGDFYTASDVGAAIGRLLARQFDEIWRALDSPAALDLIELGPGRGLCAADVLDFSRRQFPAFHTALRYTLVESSPALRERLRERFAAHLGPAGPGPRVSLCASLDKLPAPCGCGIVFANEFFDALPIEIVTTEGQLHIAVEGDRFVERFLPPAPAVLEFLDRYGVRPAAGERVEAPLAALEYVRRAAALVQRGCLVFIDYGYTREELLAGRPKSTLRAFRRHTLSDHPYEVPGDQDLTAHVNFSALRAAAAGAGFDRAALLTQAQFLMGIGERNQFADAFADAATPQERARVALQLKNLATPAGMGELFQVLVACRGVPADAVARLSGLAFARF